MGRMKYKVVNLGKLCFNTVLYTDMTRMGGGYNSVFSKRGGRGGCGEDCFFCFR